jgi:hypothetical protein
MFTRFTASLKMACLAAYSGLTDGRFVHQVCGSRLELAKTASYPMVDLQSNKFCDDTDLVTKRNAHIKWAFATSLDGMDVGCAGKI